MKLCTGYGVTLPGCSIDASGSIGMGGSSCSVGEDDASCGLYNPAFSVANCITRTCTGYLLGLQDLSFFY